MAKKGKGSIKGLKESLEDLQYILKNPEGTDKEVLKDIVGTAEDILFEAKRLGEFDIRYM